MNNLRNSLLVKLRLPEKRKILVCHLYRSLLKGVTQKKIIDSDLVIKTFLKTQIMLEFLEAKNQKSFEEIHKTYCNGLEFLNIIENCEQDKNSQILTELAYGPKRFLKSFAFYYANEKKVGVPKATKMIEEEIFHKKMGYNYAIPKEFLEYMNSKPEQHRRFQKICQPDLENFFK